MVTEQLPTPERLPGSITLETDGDLLVLCFSGEIDSAVVEGFRESRRRPAPIDAIEAGTVTFISSAGLALMLLWWEAARAAGRAPTLRRMSSSAERVVRQAGLNAIFVHP